MKINKENKQKSVGRYEAIRCKFETNGNQCRMIGDIGSYAGEGARCYCQFHYTVITTTSELNKYVEFIKWIGEWKERSTGSCCNEGIDERGHTYLRPCQLHKYQEDEIWQMMGNG